MGIALVPGQALDICKGTPQPVQSEPSDQEEAEGHRQSPSPVGEKAGPVRKQDFPLDSVGYPTPADQYKQRQNKSDRFLAIY